MDTALAAARFERYIERTDACWLWTGAATGSNALYGYFTFGGRQWMAHRFAYELWVGPIPEGHEVDHVTERGCTSKLCVNPAHLEPVTHAENRKRARKVVCVNGHDLTIPRNQRWDENVNRRGCAQCNRDRMNARYAARKAGQ
jgi:hypothetical protein